MKICPVGTHLFHADGRTDRRTEMKKLIGAFRNFAKSAQKKAIRFIKQLGMWTWRGVEVKLLRNTFSAPDGGGCEADAPFV